MLQTKVYRTLGHLTTALIVASALGWSAYHRGMFFDSDLYSFEITIFAALLIWLIVQIGLNRLGNIPLWTVLPLGMCFLYAVKLGIGPSSINGTVDAILRWFTYASWSLLLWGVWKSPESRMWGWGAIQASGLLLAAGGWAGWFGWISFTDIVLKFNDLELSATGARLAGFMQYPNAFGAILAAFLLMQLQEWAANGKSSARAWLAAVTVIPYGGALLLTESRGAIGALLVGFALSFFLLDRRSRGRLLLISGLTAIGSSIVVKYAWSWMQAESSYHTAEQNLLLSFELWAISLCALVGAGLLAWLHQYLNRVTIEKARDVKNERGEGLSSFIRRWTWIVLPWLVAALGIIVAGWLLLVNAGERIVGHYGTVSSRALFYADAWEMFKDSPWLGYGGESWRMVFGLYQQQPYVGNEVHSGYIETGIDLGILGLVMLLLLLFVYIIKMWRYKRTAIAPAAVLLAHAAIDFDWSYAFVWLLLIAWVILHSSSERKRAATELEVIALEREVNERERTAYGGAVTMREWTALEREENERERTANECGGAVTMREGTALEREENERERTANECGGAVTMREGTANEYGETATELEGTAERAQSNAFALLGRAGLALLLICSAALGLWAAWRADAAHSLRAAAGLAAHPAARAAKLHAALDANPAWGRIRLELAPLLPLQERASLLAAGLRYEPHAPQLLLQLGIVYAELGDVAQASSSLGEALRLRRFSREGHNAAIASMASLARRLNAVGDVERMREASEAVVAMFEQFRKLDREIASMDKPANGLRFGMTTAAKLHAAECLLLLQRSEAAVILLREIVQEDDEDWREQALELLGTVGQ